MNKKPLINEDGEVREISFEDMKLFKRSSEVLPDELFSVLPKRGRPIKQSPKVSTTIRLSPDVIMYFKAHGKGWQTEIDDILKRHVKRQRKQA